MKTLQILFFIILSAISINAQQRSFTPTHAKGAERRLALVIGNKDYTNIGALKNPINDALDISKAFQQLGFEVTTITNADYKKMLNVFNVFTKNLQKNDVVVFYYSGHGISYDGKNFLIPTDASITCLEEVEENALTLGRLMTSVEARNVKNSFVFLDACRNLPNLKQCNSAKRDVVISKGLVRPTNNPSGSMTVYATREGDTADDNATERNGLFTSEFLKYITVPNLGLRQILDRTKKGVETRSNKRQSPARYDELSDDFVFVLTNDAPTTTKPVVNNTPTIVNTPPTKPQTDQLFMQMAFIKGGTFQMGDTRDEGNNLEKPVHQVTMSDFWMGKYEVTQRQWEDIMGTNPSFFKNCSECPVENVSWDNVQDFLKKLNQKTGFNYRLPTEAEWEYTAGGGAENRTRFGNGQDILKPTEANFHGSESYKKDYSEVGEYRGKTTKVGTFPPNRLSLYDMTGNVWEWCQDWYNEYSSQYQQNPFGKNDGITRVVRGGSWSSNPQYSRLTDRSSNHPTHRMSNIGFRVVQDITSEKR